MSCPSHKLSVMGRPAELGRDLTTYQPLCGPLASHLWKCIERSSQGKSHQILLRSTSKAKEAWMSIRPIWHRAWPVSVRSSGLQVPAPPLHCCAALDKQLNLSEPQFCD